MDYCKQTKLLQLVKAVCVHFLDALESTLINVRKGNFDIYLQLGKFRYILALKKGHDDEIK